MAVVTQEGAALAELRDRLRGERSGEVEVTDVRLENLLDEDADEYVLVTLVLNDPAPGRETWPVASVVDLSARARAEAVSLDVRSRVVFTVRTRADYDDGDGGAE